jgi:hypothetical protein
LFHGFSPPLFSPKKNRYQGTVTVCSSSFFKNRPSPTPYVAGNNNYPDNNRDPYGVDDGLDAVHNDPFQKSALPITARFDLVKRIL